MNTTKKNVIDFEIRMASRNLQLTLSHLISDSDKKIRDGNAKLPT